jgi:hypothetical protein
LGVEGEEADEGELPARVGVGALGEAGAASTRPTGTATRAAGGDGCGMERLGEVAAGVDAGGPDAVWLGGMAGMLVAGRGLATHARLPPLPPSLPPPLRLRSPSAGRLGLAAAARA